MCDFMLDVHAINLYIRFDCIKCASLPTSGFNLDNARATSSKGDLINYICIYASLCKLGSLWHSTGGIYRHQVAPIEAPKQLGNSTTKSP